MSWVGWADTGTYTVMTVSRQTQSGLELAQEHKQLRVGKWVRRAPPVSVTIKLQWWGAKGQCQSQSTTQTTGNMVVVATDSAQLLGG